jgi:hypothetical protein
MQLSDIANVLWIAGALGELILLCVLVYRKTYRDFPIFFGWIVFAVVSEPVYYLLNHHLAAVTYAKVFFALTFSQFVLEAAVLVELAASVFKPVQRSVPRWSAYVLVVLMVVIGVVAFIVSTHLNSSTLSHPRAFVVMSASMAILRLVTFICISAMSQILGLGWRNQVLLVASGFAFYAIVTLIVEIGHSHLRAGPDYASRFTELDNLRIAGYLCALYYWCYSFARKEAPKKEFNSKMSELLISMSGTTKQQQSIVARKRK